MPYFYATWTFIINNKPQLIDSITKSWIHCTFSHTVSLTVTLSSHIQLRLLRHIFSRGFLMKTSCIFHFPHVCCICLACAILHLVIEITLGKQHVYKLWNSLLCCSFHSVACPFLALQISSSIVQNPNNLISFHLPTLTLLMSIRMIHFSLPQMAYTKKTQTRTQYFSAC